MNPWDRRLACPISANAGSTTEVLFVLDRRAACLTGIKCWPISRRPEKSVLVARLTYNDRVEKKIFWIVFILLGLVADFVLPLWWGLVATLPIAVVSWWVAYRSEWF